VRRFSELGEVNKNSSEIFKKASGTKCKIWFNQRAKNIGTTITAANL
jgi:hypothetical protein